MPSSLYLSACTLLCIFDHVLPRLTTDAELSRAQETHNALSLVSRAVRELVSRYIRYKTMCVPTPERAWLLVNNLTAATCGAIRAQLRGLAFG